MPIQPAFFRPRACLLRALSCAVLLCTPAAAPTTTQAQEMPGALSIPLAQLWALDASSHAPAAGSAAIAPQIHWPNGEYRESHMDLRIKILGGYLDITRSWRQGRWWLNPA